MYTSNKASLQTLEMILRVLAQFQFGRLVVVIDEFEAIDSQDDRSKKETLQSLQDLFDDFAGRVVGLPSTYLLLLSTPDWAERTSNLLPSLLGRGQRLGSTHELQAFSANDVAGLVYQYMKLVQLHGNGTVRDLEPEEVRQVIDEVCQENSAYLHQVRALHHAVREKLLSRMLMS